MQGTLTPLDIFPLYAWLLFAGFFGSIWGSFANVVICRWPRGRSVSFPASHCPVCGTPIHPWDNIPVLSYLLLRARCRSCGVTISARYPVVELAVAMLSVAAFKSTVMVADSFEWYPFIEYLVTFAFCWSLVVVAFIDLDTQLIPTTLTTVMAVVGIASHLLLPGGTPKDAALGMVLGFVVVWALGQGYKLVRGELGMGLGDAYLMAMIGATLGWQGALFSLTAGAVQGALAQLVMYVSDRKWREGPVSAWRRPVPFGPFLAIGALEMVILGSYIEPWLRELLIF